MTIYAQPVQLDSDVESWEILEDIREKKINLPVEAPPPRRCLELKIYFVGEDVNRRLVKCGWNNERGHNRKKCKNLIMSNPN